MEKLIKNVDEPSWRKLKSEAAKHGKPIGKFISYLVTEHVKMKTKSNWEAILNNKKTLTKMEAEKTKNAISMLKEEYDFE